MSKVNNPFLVYGYEGPEYFCDREAETEVMVSAMHNGCNMTLMSPRRYGKTGLIHHVFHRMKEADHDMECFYIDLYATKTLSDMVKVLAKAVIGKLESTLAEIFAYMSQSERKCYIALDEFQQVMEYPEDNVEALLRTYIQQTHNVHFIFAGSKLHMMDEMFNSPRHPFYRSTEKLNLHTIPEPAYYEFAAEKLKDKNIEIPMEVFHSIYAMVDGVTWYMQAIMNHLYRLHDIVIEQSTCNDVVMHIIQAEEDNYKRMYHMLTANQASLLRSIAADGCVKEPMSGSFIRQHQLKSASSVQRAMQFLCDEEYVYHSEEGYIIYDRFFARWLGNL